ncbi:hypothetical protein NLX86_28050 [Streptomyces sp. A3M-1-3]|uniref:hypothetical protein n=1 Tax=Streptomyces sp. A3M-1-3 TaxID=2962044 RepID=UPI0020B7881C|nr:hypothetical protein [Streptomyces sp. A3M-1-3]MCP3821805.1 hypothetical protein [Streptomyces sp. A3M-1-3]
MHRTRTTTTLLLGVAVSAVSGCVSVDPATPSPVPARHEPRLTREAEPKFVQAPAREALDAAGRTPVPEPASTRPVQPPPERPSAAVPPSPPRVEPRQPADETRTPRRVLPSTPVETVDVCALGREYGGWRADSPESRICRDTYGN